MLYTNIYPKGLSRIISVILVHTFILSDLVWAAPDLAATKSSLSLWTANERPQTKTEAIAMLYRQNKLIWIADSERYLEILNEYNALAE